MSTLLPRKLLGVLLVLGCAGVVAALTERVLQDDGPPPLPAAPQTAPVTLVLARPFTVEVPWVHAWRAEQPQVSAGVVLVLAVADRELLYPRQDAEPVLYVGAQTAERLNHGYESGHVVAIVPAGVDEAGRVDLDLAATPIFFGDPELPERIDAAAARAQLEKARAQGARAPDAEQVQAALTEQVAFEDDFQVRQWAADLIETWSPQEADLVAGLRQERLQR